MNYHPVGAISPRDGVHPIGFSILIAILRVMFVSWVVPFLISYTVFSQSNLLWRF